MNVKLKNTAPFLDDDWIDEDDTPEFSDVELEAMNMKFSRGGKVIYEAKGFSKLLEKFKEIKPNKQKISLKIKKPASSKLENNAHA